MIDSYLNYNTISIRQDDEWEVIVAFRSPHQKK